MRFYTENEIFKIKLLKVYRSETAGCQTLKATFILDLIIEACNYFSSHEFLREVRKTKVPLEKPWLSERLYYLQNYKLT
jgi:hypothetical protein